MSESIDVVTCLLSMSSNVAQTFLLSCDRKYGKYNHERFFPFEKMTHCKSTTCIGGDCATDLSKFVCGVDQLKAGCVVYSIGGNNQWEFELDLVKKTPCHVYTFDCTGPKSRFQVPNHPRIHFHHVCLTPYSGTDKFEGMEGEAWTLLEMQQNLGHSRIDLLKMDVEGRIRT